MKKLISIFVLFILLAMFLSTLSVTGSDNPITTLGNGNSEEIIEFPDGGGDNTDLSLKIPEDAQITSAELELKGLGVIGNSQKYTHDYFDTVNNDAYHGLTTQHPPTSPPSSFMGTAFSNTDYTQVRANDNIRFLSYAKGANNFPYQMYRLKITETAVSFLNVHWEGYGWYSGASIAHYQAYLYIYNVSATNWELFGSNSTDIKPNDFVMDCPISGGVDHYLDSSRYIHVLIEGPQIMDSNEYSDLYTDFIEIETTARVTVYPTDPSLDVGDDGDFELSIPGTFDMKMVLDTNKFKTELQSFVDAATPGIGIVDIPLKFTSTSAGKIKVCNISIGYSLNYAPELNQEFLSDTYGFYEDSNGGDNLIDLNDHFWDDNDNGSLIFSILKNSDKISAEIDPDGYHLDFTAEPDYFGTQEFQIRALDLGFDGVEGGDTDLYTDSNIFTVTVWPTNDAPVIETVGKIAVTGDGDTIEFKGTNGAVEDEWFYLDITSRDIDGDILSYLVNQTWESPAVIELVPDIDDSNIAELSIFATNEHVGMLYLNISVSDNNETGSTRAPDPSSGPLFDVVNIGIEISNVNDEPVLDLITEEIGNEDEWLNFTVTATDDDIIYGDVLEFSTNITDEIDGLKKDKNYVFDKFTGEISILPDNEMVGNYWVEFEVEDLDGESDQITVKIIINNVNDPPVPVIDSPLHQEVFNTTVLIYFDGANSTDDDFIHGDSLTYTWHSDQSSTLSTEPQFSMTLTDTGWHNITLTVKDSSKVEIETVISIKIAPAADGGDGPGNDPPDDPGAGEEVKSEEGIFDTLTGLIILVVICAIIIVIGIVIFIWQRKRTEEEFARELEEEAKMAQLEAEQLQMIQPPPMQGQPPMVMPPVIPPPVGPGPGSGMSPGQTQLPFIPPPPIQPPPQQPLPPQQL